MFSWYSDDVTELEEETHLCGILFQVWSDYCRKKADKGSGLIHGCIWVDDIVVCDEKLLPQL